MDEKKQKMVERVLKLLELGDADNNSNPNERESAMRMAAKLMAEHAIDFVDLRDGQKKDETFITIDIVSASTQKVSWQAALAAAIARTFDCKVISRAGREKWTLTFVGMKSDLEIATFFYKSLRRTVGRMGETTYEKVADRNTYCYGMVLTIADRLTDLFARRAEFIPSDCRDLVLVKTQELDKHYKNLFPNAVNSRKTTLSGSKDSFEKGKADGKKVALNRPIGHANGASARIAA